MSSLSENWNAILDYLLSTKVDDPLAEGRFGSRLMEYSAEPSETISILRRNAYYFASHPNSEWDISDEESSTAIKFIKVEAKIQLKAYQTCQPTLAATGQLMIVAAIVVGSTLLAMAGVFSSEGVIAGLAFLSLVLLIGLAPQFWQSRRTSQRAKRAIILLNQGLGPEDRLPGFWV